MSTRPLTWMTSSAMLLVWPHHQASCWLQLLILRLMGSWSFLLADAASAISTSGPWAWVTKPKLNLPYATHHTLGSARIFVKSPFLTCQGHSTLSLF